MNLLPAEVRDGKLSVAGADLRSPAPSAPTGP